MIMLRCSLAAILFSSVAFAQSVTISPYGPIKTLAEGRDAARALRRSGVKGPITITVHAGTYFLPETLILQPEDSDTIWEAPHGEHPIISGGRAIAGWQKGPGNQWHTETQSLKFSELFVDGRRATRARTPNYGYFRIDGESSQAKPFELHYRGNDIREAWAGPGDVEVIVLLAWSELRMPIVKVDQDKRIATLASNPRPYNREADARYYIENTADALDAPGEWYLDRTSHIVSYIPTPDEDMSRTTVIVPVLDRLVSVEGDGDSGRWVHDVRFRGLTFVNAGWSSGPNGYADTQAASDAPSAIEAAGAIRFSIDHCTFAHSGGYAIFLGRETRDSSVTASEIYDMGGGGIKIGEPGIAASKFQRNYGHYIADNQIHDLGLAYPSAVGIWVLQSARNRILHNHIHDLFYSAISVGWTWGYGPEQAQGNLIAYNNVHDVGKGVLSDLGGIYTLGRQPGTQIRNNLVHDVTSFTYGGWGIYLDEGSSDISIEDNIVYRCKSAGFHQHYGRDNILQNNIFAFNHDFQLMRTRAEDHVSFTFDRNIVYFDQGELLGSNWSGGIVTHHNIYYNTQTPNLSFAGHSFREWQLSGQDLGSLIANPLFVNAGNFDFRLKSSSPAFSRGFQEINISSIGPRVPAGANAW